MITFVKNLFNRSAAVETTVTEQNIVKADSVDLIFIPEEAVKVVKANKEKLVMTTTKLEKAVQLFAAGLRLTEGELATRLNTTRVGARSIVRSLREDGYAIYLNEGTLDSRGRQRQSRYRLGTPSRKMVAAAYATQGAAAFAHAKH